MKNTRRFIAGFSALAMAAAMAMSASAADPTPIVSDDSGNPNPGTADAEVTYYVNPSYIVTIPAGADISSGSDVQSITANDVLLEQGKKITVTLFEASNTESGKLFTAKDESGESTVNYTIKAGTADVAVGDTVAEFETKTGEQSATLTFTKDADSTPTYAGEHSETLTFNIAVENAAPANPYADKVVGDVVTFGEYDWYIIGKSDNGVTLLMKENLMNKAYNDEYKDVTWESCTLRAYLNGEFYNSFDAEDKAKIVQTHNTNPDNGSVSGGNDTEDYIYLLSIAEAKALSDTIRANGSSWWLRSPGSASYFGAFVNGGGDVLTNGGNVRLQRGARPALNLEF